MYNVGNLHIITKLQKILKSGAVNQLQNGRIIITEWGTYYKKGRFITKSDRHYKLGIELLQSGAGNSLENRSIVIAKYGSYH